MVKHLICFALALTFVTSGTLASDAGHKAKGERPEKGEREKKPAPEMQQVVVTGTVTREQVAHKNKKTGEESMVDRLVLVAADGAKTALPQAHGKGKGDGNGGQTDLTAYVGQTVTITGMGYSRTKKSKDGETTSVALRKITSVVAAGDGAAGDGAAGDGAAEDE